MDIKKLDSFFDGYAPMLGGGLLRDNRLERMELLLSHLGNPEKSFRAIHIAGSKGKGSTAFFISRMLTKSGIKCGLYLSPHVYDIRERFTASGIFFSNEAYMKAAEELSQRISSVQLPPELGPVKPTTFELYTAYAYILFRNECCTYAVIETGLGGRLDATNTLSPIAEIITTIELEHTEILGPTIEKIAAEKSGIIKYGSKGFAGNTSEEALAVIKKRCMLLNTELTLFNDSYKDIKINGCMVSAKLADKTIMLTLPFLSEKEGEDALLGYLALDKLRLINDSCFDLSDLSLPGRYEHVSRFIFDGAHTKASAESLRDTLLSNEDLSNSTLIFSAAEGKDIKDMLLALVPLFDRIIISKPDSFKRSDPKGIYALSKELFPDKETYLIEDSREAVIKAEEMSGIILVTGSFYLVSRIRRAINEH